MKICFICHANICRSFAAERLLRAYIAKSGKNGYEVFSRGVYASPQYEIPPKIKNFLIENGAEPQGHTSTLVSAEDLASSDLVLTMTQDQLDLLLDRYPQYSDKIFLFLDYAYGKEEDMPDPIGKSGYAFERVMGNLKKATEEVFKKI